MTQPKRSKRDADATAPVRTTFLRRGDESPVHEHEENVAWMHVVSGEVVVVLRIGSTPVTRTVTVMVAPALARARDRDIVGTMRLALALSLSFALGCGATRTPAALSTPSEVVTEARPRSTRLFFARFVEEDDRAQLYVILDETRGAGSAGVGEPGELSNDGLTMVLSRPARAEGLPPELTALRRERFVAIGGECVGTLGDVVELTIRDLGAEERAAHEAEANAEDGVGPAEPALVVLATVLAAPLGECDEGALAVYVEGPPAPHRFVGVPDAEVDVAIRDEALAAIRLRSEHGETVRRAAEARAADDGAPPETNAGTAALETEMTFGVLEDGRGRTLVSVLLEVETFSLAALLERVDGALVVRAVDVADGITTASFGTVLDIEGDGPLEILDAQGLSRDGAPGRVFRTEAPPYGC